MPRSTSKRRASTEGKPTGKKPTGKKPAARKPAKNNGAPRPCPERVEGPSLKAGSYSLYVGNTFGRLSLMLDGAAIPGVEAGKPIVVSYSREPEDMGRPDVKFRSVKMHYRVDGQQMPPVEVAGPRGHVPTTIEVPPAAKGELEYWFEIDTESGEKLWDSDFGKNYSFGVQPR